MHVHTVSPENATGPVRDLYDIDIRERGYVPNYTRLFSLHPGAYAAWGALAKSIRERMRLRRYELVTLAAARALGCRYCVSAHGAVVLGAGLFGFDEVEAIVRDYHDAGLTAAEIAIMELAEMVVTDAHSVGPPHIDRLRGHGLTDPDIFDVVLAAAARAFFSKTLDAMGALPDAELSATNGLADALPRTGC